MVQLAIVDAHANEAVGAEELASNSEPWIEE